MFIGNLPALLSQWIALDSLVSSSRNDAFSDNCAESVAKPVLTAFFILTHLVLKLKGNSMKTLASDVVALIFAGSLLLGCGQGVPSSVWCLHFLKRG